MKAQRDIMMKYGGYSKNEKKRSYMDAFVKPILKSKEYTLKEIYGYVRGYKFVLTTCGQKLVKQILLKHV
jgi:hypothetical protein